VSGAGSVDVSGRIAVTDETSPTIRKIESAISRMGETGKKVGASFKNIFNKGAFGGVAKNVANVGTQMGRLGASIFKVLGPLSLLAGAAGFGGLVYEMTNYISTTAELARTSAKIGVGVEALQQLRHAARLSGVSIETLDGSLGQLNKRIAGAASGENKKLAALFGRLGISLKDSNGQMRGAADLMPQLASAFQKNTNAVTRAQIANELFGKSGAAMINLLSGGRGELEAMMAELVKLGQITTAEAQTAVKAAEAQVRFGTAMKGVTNTLSAGLLPALIPVIEGMTNWIAANRVWLAQGMERFIEGIGRGLERLEPVFAAVIAGARAFGRAFAWAFEAVGGFDTVIPALAAVLGGVLLKSVFALTLAIGKLTIALLTNPIVLLITAIAVAAFLIWKYWEPISKFFINLWAGVAAVFTDALGWVDDFVSGFVPGGLLTVWNGLAAGFQLIWESIKFAFDIHAWFALLLVRFVPDAIIAAWNFLAPALEAIWHAIKAVFDITTWFPRLVAVFIPDGIMTVWRPVADFFETVMRAVSGAFQTAWSIIKPIIDFIMAAVGPVLEAAGKIAAIGGKVIGAGASAARSVVGGARDAVSGSASSLYNWATGGGAPAAPAREGLVTQQAQQQTPVARIDGEVETRVKIEAGPGLIASATTKDSGRVHSTVDVGRSMQPAT
jgi:phage-related protein